MRCGKALNLFLFVALCQAPTLALADDTLSQNQAAQLGSIVEAVPELRIDLDDWQSKALAFPSPIEYLFTFEEGELERLEKPRYSTLLRERWDLLLFSLERRDFQGINAHVKELQRLKIAHGLEALEDYSVVLLDNAKQRIIAAGKDRMQKAQARDEAGYITRQALLLSPEAPAVLIRAMPFMGYANQGSALGNLYKAMAVSWDQPLLVLEVIKNCIYPLLWALSFGLYIVLVIHFGYRIKQLLIGIAGYLPRAVTGLLAPSICVGVLVGPILLGPLWCLFVWSALVLIFFPQNSWLAFWVGATIVLWGALIPIRETLHTWLNEKSFQTMLNVSAGHYNAADKAALEELLPSRQEDGVVFYIYGQLLRRLGELDSAEQAMQRAEMLLGDHQPWTKAQRSLIAYLRGDFAKADTLASQAQKQGLNSVEFLFNYSKVKFHLNETEAARDLFSQAHEKDSKLTLLYRDRESELGMESNRAVADPRLPIRKILASAMQPLAGALAHQDRVSKLMMLGCTPVLIMLLGALLIVCFIFRSNSSPRKNYLMRYVNSKPSNILKGLLHVIPGGALVARGRLTYAFLIVVTVIFMLMPIIAWPSKFLIVEPGTTLFDLNISVLFTFILISLAYGWKFREER